MIGKFFPLFLDLVSKTLEAVLSVLFGIKQNLYLGIRDFCKNEMIAQEKWEDVSPIYFNTYLKLALER